MTSESSFSFAIISLIVLQYSIATNSESVDSNATNTSLGEPLILISCCDELSSCNKGSRNASRDTASLGQEFSIVARPLNCSEGKEISVVDIPLDVDIPTEGAKIIDKVLREIGARKFLQEEYCVSSVTSKEIQVQVCKLAPAEDKCADYTTCIRKCCGVGEVYDLTNYGFDRIACVPAIQPWSPTFYKNVQEKVDDSETVAGLKSAYIVSSHPREEWCQDDPFLRSQRKIGQEKRSLIRVLENGTVLAKDHYKEWQTLLPGSFCIDGAQNIPGYNTTVYLGDELDTIVIDCSYPVKEIRTSTPLVYGILQAIASCFLLLTAIVYVILWERQNIHSWTLLGFVISMLFLYASFTATYFHVHFWEDVTEHGASLFCSALAVATHFFFLSTYCWMTIISFDVWWTFRDLKFTVGNNKRRLRFMGYVLAAYGPPSIVVGVGLSLDDIYKENIESDVIRPEYGGSNCFMDLKYAVFPYLFLPGGILLASNLIFFGVTVYALYKIGESTKFATNMSSQSQPGKAKLFLFLKLFVVMGLTWSLDVISWYFFGAHSTNPLVYLIDTLNILQPVAIFIIFVCKKTTIRALQEKYPLFARLLVAIKWKGRSRRSTGSNLTDDTNISTSSMRSISGAHQQVSLNTTLSLKTHGF